MTETEWRGPLPSRIMRDQIDNAVGIPRELYLSEELFEREVTAIFNRSWLFAGHESQLERPGQYLTVESGAESVIVARTADGQLAAFQNVCRHRGARLVDAGCGQARRLVCPYHQWTYRLDGTLQGAPKMPDGFDVTQFPLAPVSVQTWQGLIVVNLAEHPGVPIDGLLGAADAVIAPFALDQAKVAHRISYEVAANWKIVWENAQECYHCSANHPEFIKSFDVAPLGDPEWDASEIHRSDDARVQFTRFPLKPGAVSLTLDGQPASARPMGRFAESQALHTAPYTAAAHLKPSFALVCCPDYAVVMAERPISVDRTDVEMIWLVDQHAEKGRDYDLDNLIKVWDHTNRQDWDLCARTQQGVQSRWFVPGPLSCDEASVAGFHHAYAELLAAADL